MKGTAGKKMKLPGITLQDHVQVLKKKRPDIYAALKHPDPHINLAWNVLKFRTQQGYTQTQLAAQADITSRTIQNIENVNSGYNPTLDVITGIAEVFKLRPEDLIKTVDLTENF